MSTALKEKLAEGGGIQPKITNHTVKVEPVVPYSDDLFRSAAIEWLVATDQVGKLSNTISL